MEKYEPLRKLAENLYCVDGDWYNTPWRRRMTIVALSSGELVIHSAIQMSNTDMGELDKLGKVAFIVPPNSGHGSEAQWYADRYPTAKVLVPYDAGGKLRKMTRIDGTLEDDWPNNAAEELPFVPILGARLHEAVFLHRASRTLILADLGSNLATADFKPGFLKRFVQWNGMLDKFGPNKLFDRFVITDRYKFRSSIDRILEWDFDRVIVSHGKLIETGGHALFKAAYMPLFARMPERRNEPRSPDA